MQKECQGWIIKIVFLWGSRSIFFVVQSPTQVLPDVSGWRFTSFHSSLCVPLLLFCLSSPNPPGKNLYFYSSVWQKQEWGEYGEKNEESIENRMKKVQKIAWTWHSYGLKWFITQECADYYSTTNHQFHCSRTHQFFHHFSLCFKHCRAISRIFKSLFCCVFGWDFFDIRAIPSLGGCWKLAIFTPSTFFSSFKDTIRL